MSKHTPGPWKMRPTGLGEQEHFQFSSHGHYPHLFTKHLASSWNKSKADARLIAQSPAMLKALKDLIALYEAHTDGFARQVLRKPAENAQALVKLAEEGE